MERMSQNVVLRTPTFPAGYLRWVVKEEQEERKANAKLEEEENAMLEELLEQEKQSPFRRVARLVIPLPLKRAFRCPLKSGACFEFA